MKKSLDERCSVRHIDYKLRVKSQYVTDGEACDE